VGEPSDVGELRGQVAITDQQVERAACFDRAAGLTLRVAAGDRLIVEEACGVPAPAAMVPRPAEPVAGKSFQVGYVSEDQVEHWAPVAGTLAVPFERCGPVRWFTSNKRQRYLRGLWWSATTGWCFSTMPGSSADR
jgi:hypothetical protein